MRHILNALLIPYYFLIPLCSDISIMSTLSYNDQNNNKKGTEPTGSWRELILVEYVTHMIKPIEKQLSTDAKPGMELTHLLLLTYMLLT